MQWHLHYGPLLDFPEALFLLHCHFPNDLTLVQIGALDHDDVLRTSMLWKHDSKFSVALNIKKIMDDEILDVDR